MEGKTDLGRSAVLGTLSVPERHSNLDNNRARALAVGAGGGVGHFSLVYLFFFLPLWETARYKLKHCPKGPLNPTKQPTNQSGLIGRIMANVALLH